MSERAVARAPVRVATPTQPAVLQRACACGQHTNGGGECEQCKKQGQLQRKLAVGASNDPLEREADRIANQVLAGPSGVPINGAPVSIRRFVGQASENAASAPPSVDRVLASSGRPLAPALRQDMEQRFGHDFSRVRVHSGAAAEQSAHEVNAHAYTVGPNIVFGAGQFAPETHEGRRLMAHELTHVVQQTGIGGPHAGQSGVGAGHAAPAVQRNNDKPQKEKKVVKFTVESDHGFRGRYLVFFSKPLTRDGVLGILFEGGTLPQALQLEEVGIQIQGWAWKLTAASGVIDAGTYQQFTPALAKHFNPEILRLTEEESEAIHARSEAFMASRPVYLGGQSVREAFQECKGHNVGGNCWGRRAGFFYYVGWAPGYDGRVLEARSEWQSANINRDIEWWLNQGKSLHAAARAEEQHLQEILQQQILAFAGALSSVPGAVKRPTLPPPSTVGQVGRIVATGAQTYAAVKQARGENLDESDMYVMALAGIAAGGADIIDARKRLVGIKATTPRTTTPPTPTPRKTGSDPIASAAGSESTTGYSRTAPTSEEEIASAAGRTRRPVGAIDRGKGARPRYANDPVKPKVPPKPGGGGGGSAGPKRERVDELIDETRQALNEERLKVVAEREATIKETGQTPGGQPKRLWNLKERLALLRMKKTFPQKRFLEQARIVGVKTGSALKTTEEIAGEARIPDWIEIDGKFVQPGDFKSANAQLSSVKGGVKNPATVEGEYRSKSTIAMQMTKEGKVSDFARQNGGKIVIEGKDVVTGEKVRLEVAPDELRPSVVTDYEAPPNN